MASLLSQIPREWKTDVVVKRGGGRDRHGNPVPTEDFPRKGVLVSPRTANDAVDFSGVTTGTMSLYDEDRGDGFKYQPGDIIVIPAGARMAGTWAIDGRPGEWYLGTQVDLVKA